jgi:DNA replication protein DnaC
MSWSEAQQQNAVKRVLARWLRYDLIVLDEVGYVPLAEIGAEFVSSDRGTSGTGGLDPDHEPAVF